MEMEKLNTYQACFFTENGEDGKRELTDTTLVKAETLKAAYETIECADGQLFYVYPLVTMGDGESVKALAAYTVKQFHKWGLRNNNALMSTLNRSEWDKEDEFSTACLAIIEHMANDETANMCDVYHAAFNSLTANRDKLFRKSECEYNPERLFCNMGQFKVKETYPELCGLLWAAKTELALSGNLTDAQIEVVEMYGNRTAVVDIAEKTGRNRKNTYKLLYKAEYQILKKMVEMDGETLETFAKADLTKEDVETALTIFKKRAGTK